nr:glycerate kinase [Bacteroidales bacterium]
MPSSPYRILVAPDSFKGSLSAREAADAICEGIRRFIPAGNAVPVCISDGGEGFTEAILAARGGQRRVVRVSDPLGRPVEAAYGLCADTAVIEMAAASGLPLLKESERNPLLTSTFGTGEMIRDALERGCRELLIGLGGSATHDAGTGMLSALGFHFRDASGRELPGCGASLARIAEIDRRDVLPALAQSRFTVACDVQTVFCGPEGAAAVFARQKGATPGMIRELERGSSRFAGLVREQTGCDLRTEPGSGAAGGLGGAF